MTWMTINRHREQPALLEAGGFFMSGEDEMQNQLPDVAAQVAEAPFKASAAILGLGVEGLIAAARVAKEVKEVPNDAIDSILEHFEASLRILSNLVQHGEAPK